MSDSFTYKANDGTEDGNTATVNITINPVNDAPVAAGDSYPVDEGGTLNQQAPGVLLNDTDAENDPLTAILVTGVSRGSLTLNNDGSFIYVHDGTETMSDSFTYKVNDGTTDSNIATVTITVNPIEDDSDRDGLTDELESTMCTDPFDADTDDDGIPDGVEDANHNGVVDPGETDPCYIDSDGDGIQDGTELGYTLSDVGPHTDTNIFQPDLDPTTTTDPLDRDTDNDGLLDGEEDMNRNGMVDAGETDPGVDEGFNAGVALDMIISTRNYDDTISNTDIESTVSIPANGEVCIAVVAQGVANLDTYQVEVTFDTDMVEFIGGAEENPFGGIINLLKKNGGETVGFQAVESVAGTVNIANSLAYEDCDQAPEGSGIIALLNFRVLDADPDNQLTLGNVFFVNCIGYEEEITNLTNGSFIPSYPWDFNTDGIINYLDLGLFADHWLLRGDDSDWDPRYNLSLVPDSGNQIINYLDLGIFADHWLEEIP